MKTTRVLHIGEYVQGGVATYLDTLFSDRDGLDTYVVMSDEKSEHRWRLDDACVYYYSYQRGIRSLLPAIFAVQKKIKEIQPDVIYCHSTWAGLIGRLPLLFAKTCRVIYNAHGWAFLRDTAEWKRKLYAAVERVLARATDTIVNVSYYEYKSAIRYGLPKDKMVVIYSGILDEKKKSMCPVQMDKNKINLLFVGRFDPQKGVDFLLQVYQRIKRTDIHLYLIGDNVVSANANIPMKGDQSMSFLGWIPHDALSGYYETCDAVIMPSRWEAFGLTAVEAMQHGKPVIVSDRGALPELVQDGVNGWVFHYDENGDGLYRLLMNLTKQDIRSKEQAAYHTYLDRFTAKRMINATRALLQGLSLS